MTYCQVTDVLLCCLSFYRRKKKTTKNKKQKTKTKKQNKKEQQQKNTIVWPTTNYGIATWGTKEYSCINAVQNWAFRYILGVGTYTPNNCVNGDIAWTPVCKQWKRVLKLIQD